jgi:hypothetical protein
MIRPIEHYVDHNPLGHPAPIEVWLWEQTYRFFYSVITLSLAVITILFFIGVYIFYGNHTWFLFSFCSNLDGQISWAIISAVLFIGFPVGTTTYFLIESLYIRNDPKVHPIYRKLSKPIPIIIYGCLVESSIFCLTSYISRNATTPRFCELFHL